MPKLNSKRRSLLADELGYRTQGFRLIVAPEAHVARCAPTIFGDRRRFGHDQRRTTGGTPVTVAVEMS